MLPRRLLSVFLALAAFASGLTAQHVTASLVATEAWVQSGRPITVAIRLGDHARPIRQIQYSRKGQDFCPPRRPAETFENRQELKDRVRPDDAGPSGPFLRHLPFANCHHRKP